jgi:DDE superfamily endonuclease
VRLPIRPQSQSQIKREESLKRHAWVQYRSWSRVTSGVLLSVIGAVQYGTSKVFYKVVPHFDAQELRQYIHQVMATFSKSGKEVVMVVDRSGIHRAHKLDATLEHYHDKFRFHFLPAHCGHHLNPIEGFWRVMKDAIGAGRCFANLHLLYQRTRQVLMTHQETICEPRRQGPCNMVDDLVRLSSRAWPPALPIARRGADGAGMEKRGLQACGKTGECLLSIRFTGKGGAAQALESFHFLLTVLAPLLVHRALSVRLALLGIQEHPALGDTAIGRGHDAGAIALPQGGHSLRVGLGEDRLGLTQRGWDTGDPLHLGLGELLEVVSAIEGTVGHQIRRAIGGVEVRNMVPDNLAELLGITAVTTERLHEERNTSLVLDDQLQHHLVQVRPMIPTIAVGNVHDLVVGGLIAVITAINMETGAIEVREGGARPKRLTAVAAMRL